MRSTDIDLQPNLGKIRSLLLKDHGLIAVRDVRAVSVSGPFSFSKAIEIVRDDGSLMLISVDAIGGISLRDRIYSASELESQAAARRVRDEAKFEFLHYATTEVWESIAADQRFCAAGSASTCGPAEVRKMPISHVRDGQIFCGPDSGLSIRYGKDFDAKWNG